MRQVKRINCIKTTPDDWYNCYNFINKTNEKDLQNWQKN